ncbi:unnamed protein product [Penicillium salamii]|uniref:GAT domain-containing protein n=1 Tax=Penicillium salamii TaxID=1612424 RepID=A0A9W4J0H6_9EURO|nr:unnamed protein product [Penicillium salamii]CAG8366115.1 unnamed protein product [Penicillium salamii]CAG8386834.1 unnamed protein product [Penicillium salamii]CAG8388943.1 unnamed protein product [Penicillium salamii]
MKRFVRTWTARSSSSDSGTEHREDSPEAMIRAELEAFCESSANGASQGAEVVHLPKIVDAAESSPEAAKEAALRIRKYLADPAGTSNSAQYNAIMLMRILADNPGATFTRNFDAKFVSTIKSLLRTGRDLHVQGYIRQYLDILEQQHSWDENLKLLLAMWAKEKTKTSRGLNKSPPIPPRSYNMPASVSRPQRNALPSPEELAARIEEARNSAKLLTQFVQSTPPAELEGNDLVKEFLDRCQTGARLIQGFIHANNPPPDEDTLLTLIETNDEISVAISRQQRAMLKARKLAGSASPSSNVNSPSPMAASGANSPAPALSAPAPVPAAVAPAPPPPSTRPDPAVVELPNTVMTGGRLPGGTSRYEYNAEEFQVRNPFADDYETESQSTRPQDPHTDRVRFQPAEQGR